jgi:hypothetical protein
MKKIKEMTPAQKTIVFLLLFGATIASVICRLSLLAAILGGACGMSIANLFELP